MNRSRITALIATLVLCAAVCGATPREAAAITFVDTQVVASGLLIQNYINAYGQAHRFAYPPAKMVKKGGGITKQTIWPSNPWTGKVMRPGKSRGTYTYTLRNNGTAYRLLLHLSRGDYKFSGSMPLWLKNERDTGSRQNALLLQRYLEEYATLHSGRYPAATDVTPTVVGAAYTWPKNPWTGADMVAGSTLGDFEYKQLSSGASYSLRVMLSGGWSTAFAPSALAKLLAMGRG